ncbi:MAG: adenylate/guanylate cyclase domain-containing protein [Pseudomonadota bacterium]
MTRLSRLLLPLLLGLTVLAGALVVRAADPGAVQIVRERMFDLYQRVDPPPVSADIPVRIIDIDDASLAMHGQWPWPRTLMADLVNTLAQAGAATVALDMIFPEPDRSSPAAMIEGLPLDPEARRSLVASFAALPTNDEVFAQALAASPSVLGVAVTQEGTPYQPLAGFSTIGPAPTGHLMQSPASIASLPVLRDAAHGSGGIHVSARDDDAVVRRIPALTFVGDATMPSLFIEALRVAQGAQSLILRTNPSPEDPDNGIPADLRVGAFSVPLTARGEHRIRYGVMDDAMTIPAATILADTDAPQELAPLVEGTIVLVGTSAPGLFDLRATPLGTIVPGVTMHAQALANVLSGTHLTRPDWTAGLELTAMAVAGVIVLVLALAVRPAIAAFGAAAVVTALGVAAWFAFRDHLLLLDASFPTVSTLAVYGAVTVPILIGTDRQQRFIRSAFAHYLAEPVLARLEENPGALSLEGERRTITILFMDVRGFTTRSEHMEPTAAVDLLNTLLEPLSEAVLAEEGTIDKFMGDGMMAFWNAPLDQPDHAARAVRAALAMKAAIDAYNAGQPKGTEPLAIGVGLHTGEAFVGNMGSKRRFAYSAIGDSVNLAARVEAMTATLAEPVLVTGETLSAAKPHDTTLEGGFTSAGDHSVKGRRQPVTVFRLISND